MLHINNIRIYYENTDCGGVVYHSEYLKFLERSRTEMLRSVDIDQSLLLARNIGFVVKNISLDFYSPARLDNELNIFTSIIDLKYCSMKLEQVIYRSDEKLLTAIVFIACISNSSLKPKPIRIPDNINIAIRKYVK